jgi:hypothetical protein
MHQADNTNPKKRGIEPKKKPNTIVRTMNRKMKGYPAGCIGTNTVLFKFANMLIGQLSNTFITNYSIKFSSTFERTINK